MQLMIDFRINFIINYEKTRKLNRRISQCIQKQAQKAKGNRTVFEADLNFNGAPKKFVKLNESKQTLKSIKDQIDYFGYEIELFNIKNERDVGKFDDSGYFIFDRAKDKSVNDAWLDQLDQKEVEVVENQQTTEKQKQQEEPKENQDVKLEQLSIDQLKEIRYELLETNENASQAMKRVRTKLAKLQKKVFKKNVRKGNSKQNQNQMTQENIYDAYDESKQTLDILVDICNTIVKKSNDPSIYYIKKKKNQYLKSIPFRTG
ncbi:unnamed protein product [Paramecium pentaurelia]|uniref:Uncharacterized protein n=1 Tax=Paramecium pentaurelia TaxID=43138 RepID=A0A8S1WM57_9CILI|nr:unnamed protein product [Paramecium pentaurelia]